MYANLRKNRKGGGIILYVHKSMSFNPIRYKSHHFESIIGDLSLSKTSSLSLFAIYRPPDQSKPRFIHELENLIKKHSNNCNNVILVGDINIDLKKNQNIQTLYLNSLHELGMSCGIKQYTRIEYKDDILTKSCIDHIFIRNTSGYTAQTAVIDITLADHSRGSKIFIIHILLYFM